MTVPLTAPPILSQPDTRLPSRIAKSALATDGLGGGMSRFGNWFAGRAERSTHWVQRLHLDELVGWSRDPDTGNIAHHSGRFFTIEGLDVQIPDAPVPRWGQPIVNQPEVGILGIMMKEFDGVLHCLMQAKFEPGNCNGLQLSPTVQATRSNYTRVHQGKGVPYLEYFRHPAEHLVVADVLQSEQGAWFYQKRNRNMIVQVDGDVAAEKDFHWLTIGQLHRLLTVENLINMDARTVLSCLPFAGTDLLPFFDDAIAGRDTFHETVVRSCSAAAGSLHPTYEILSWITGIRAQAEVRTRGVPLAQLPDWHWVDGAISHESGLFFDVIGVDVAGGSREVASWTQPMIEPKGTGIVAFLIRRIEGVLHALVHARVEPGYVDVVEIAPTVQCTPESLRVLPPGARPRFLDTILEAAPHQIRFATNLSEEGGRFFNAINRYLIAEADVDFAEGSEYRWMTLHQLVDLLRHSHYLNVQARSLVACLHSLSAGAGLAPLVAP
ncbi:MAG: NDP-hexose 2,3-dehydratase family protein [Pseudonocardiaceae bacterium]